MEIADWLAQYKPHGISTEAWVNGPQAFVTECVLTANLGGLPAVQRYARVVANFAIWAMDRGLPLEREFLFDPATVEHYNEVKLRHLRSGSTYRSDLRRLGPLVTKKAPWPPKPRPSPRHQTAPAYTEDEVEQLWRVVDMQRTKGLRRAGRAVYLLGLGAGLDGRWLLPIRAEDIRREDCLLVEVPTPRPRTVPVVPEYADRLIAIVDEALEDGLPLVGTQATGKNAVSRVISELDIPFGLPGLSASRLRTTWLRNHIVAGTRLPELKQAAGITGLSTLDDIAATIPTYPFSKYCAEILGDGAIERTF